MASQLQEHFLEKQSKVDSLHQELSFQDFQQDTITLASHVHLSHLKKEMTLSEKKSAQKFIEGLTPSQFEANVISRPIDVMKVDEVRFFLLRRLNQLIGNDRKPFVYSEKLEKKAQKQLLTASRKVGYGTIEEVARMSIEQLAQNLLKDAHHKKQILDKKNVSLWIGYLPPSPLEGRSEAQYIILYSKK